MRKFSCSLWLVWLVIFLGWIPVVLQAFPGSGEGTESDPYLVDTWYALDAVREDLSAVYLLTEDLTKDAPGYDQLAGPAADSNLGWNPLGSRQTPFTGTFEGLAGKRIEGLQINRPDVNYLGLFSYLESSAVITNLQLVDLQIVGQDYVGGLAGYSRAEIDGLQVSGEVTGAGIYVGGLIGFSAGEGRIRNSSSAVYVEGDESVGGLAGRNTGVLASSFSTGAVSGGYRVGGLVGFNMLGQIDDCYARVEVTGLENVGGLVGDNRNTIRNCFATGAVTGETDVGGLVGFGRHGGSVASSFWDLDSSGLAESFGGSGQSTVAMQDRQLYDDADWDLKGAAVGYNDGYPFLAGEPATWLIEEPELPVKLEIQGEGTVLVDGETYIQPFEVEAGTTLELQAIPDDNYFFAGWQGDLGGTVPQQQLVVDYDRNVTVLFQPETRQLTVDIVGTGEVLVNAETYVEPVDLKLGETVEIIAIPQQHNQFIEWDGAVSSSDTKLILTVDQTLELTAYFATDTYSLEVFQQGQGSVLVDGTPYMSPRTYSPGDTVRLTAEPADKWRFEGWEEGYSGTDTTVEITVNSDLQVTARFVSDSYQLTIDLSGDGVVLINGETYSQPAVFFSGDTVILEAKPEKNWEFAGWSGDLKDTNLIVELTVESELALEAEFQPKTYQLTVEIAGVGEVNVDQQSYTMPLLFGPGETVELTAIPGVNWRFEEWTGDLTGSDTIAVLTVVSDHTVTAKFASDSYLLTVEIEGNGNVLVDGDSYTEPVAVGADDTVILTAISDPENHFRGWQGDLLSSDTKAELQVGFTSHVTAVFSRDSYLLTADLEGKGKLLVDGETYVEPLELTAWEEIELQAIADPYWQFEGWQGAISGSDTVIHLILDSDKSVAAEFVRKTGWLTLEIDGRGEIQVDGDHYSEPLELPLGETVSLEALPDSYWEFDEWTGAVNGTNRELSFIFIEDSLLTAVFRGDSYSLQISLQGAGEVLVGGTAYQDELFFSAGDTVQLEAVSQQFYYFTGWSGDLSGDDLNVELLFDSDKMVMAGFARDSYLLTIDIQGMGTVLVDGETYSSTRSIAAGDSLSLTAIPGELYEFSGWSGDLVSYQAESHLLVDTDKQVTANFLHDSFNLVIDLQGRGEVLVNGETYTEQMIVFTGQELLLEAVPGQREEFLGWQGDFTGVESSVLFTPTRDKQITAVFSQNLLEGSGTSTDPFLISDWYQLAEIENFPEAYFKLIADLTAATEGYTELASAAANGNRGWQPLGQNTGFNGQFDGNGYQIRELMIDRPGENQVGLFASLDGGCTLLNLTLVDADIVGNNQVGIAAGSSSGFLQGIVASGVVRGNDLVGGVLGELRAGKARGLASTAELRAGQKLGGVVGKINSGKLINSYSRGDLTGFNMVGGLVGLNQGEVNSSYASTNLQGFDHLGGLIGKAINGQVVASYWDEQTVGIGDSAGGVGLQTGQLKNYDKLLGAGWQITGTDDYQNQGYPYLQLSTGDWLISGILQVIIEGQGAVLVEGDTYTTSLVVVPGEKLSVQAVPRLDFGERELWRFSHWEGDLEGTDADEQLYLSSDRQVTAVFQPLFAGGDGSPENPFEIVDWYQLNNIRDYPQMSYQLTENLTRETPGYQQLVEQTADGAGWLPVGNQQQGFSGSFDGTGRRIEELYIYRPGTDGVGLFGRLTATGRIENLELGDLDITGNNRVGGLVGINQGGVLGVQNTGRISGSNMVGGLIGQMMDGRLSFSGSHGRVTGFEQVGGLVGESIAGQLEDLFATGEVTGFFQVGGLVGENYSQIDRTYAAARVNGFTRSGGLIGAGEAGSVRGSFWDVEASGTAESAGGTGLDSSEIRNLERFVEAGWEIQKSTEKRQAGYPYLTPGGESTWAKSHLLTVDIIGQGEVFVDSQQYTVPVAIALGETVLLEASVSDTGRFKGWSGAVSETVESFEFIPGESAMITATFADRDYLLTVDIVGEGTVLVDGDSYSAPLPVKPGQTVTLSASPASDHLFDGWSGDLNSSRVVSSFEVEKDMVVRADFTLIKPGLSQMLVGPNPFRGSDGRANTGNQQMSFAFNSPSAGGPYEITIYSLSGGLVFNRTTENDPYSWDLRNNRGEVVSSGYYIYQVHDRSSGDRQTGKLAIVR